MSPLINKILSTDQQSVEQSLKAGKGIYTFLNPVSYLDALKHKELFSSFDGIYADGGLLAKAIKMLYGKSVKRRSFDMTSLAPVVFSFAAKNQKTVAIVATKQEMVEKMIRWEVDENIRERVIHRLIAERYIDDERFTRAFVNDKIRYNKWGRRKVEQALWQKRIDKELQQQILDEIDENEYLNVLKPLLKQKRKTTKADNEYELNQKLYRFALSRGFTYDIIRQCINIEEEI